MRLGNCIFFSLYIKLYEYPTCIALNKQKYSKDVVKTEAYKDWRKKLKLADESRFLIVPAYIGRKFENMKKYLRTQKMARDTATFLR